MPTFMTQSTFAALTDVWRQLVAGGVPTSYVAVPWAGEQLVASGRGIYQIGIAPNAEQGSGEPSFQADLRNTEEFCRDPRHGNTPFWRFLDRLSQALLHDTYRRTQHRWGWSNLLKMAGICALPVIGLLLC